MSQIAPGTAWPTSQFSQYPGALSPYGGTASSPYGVGAASTSAVPPLGSQGLQTPSTLNSAIGGSPGLDTSSLGAMLSQIMSMISSLLTQLMGGLAGGQQSPSSADASGSPTGSPSAAYGGGQSSSPADNGGIPQDNSGGGGGGGGCHGHGGGSGNAGGASNAGSAAPPSNPAPTPAPSPSGSGSSSGSAGDSAERQQFLQLINAERAKNGLQPVKYNDKLNQAADDYAKTMSDAGQMSHTVNGTQFGDRLKQHGYNWSNAGENIADGQQSAQEVFNAWMSDQGHRDNLLNPNFTEIGLGHVNGYWDQEGATSG